MNDQAYLAQVQAKLVDRGYAEHPVPADLSGRIPVALRRTEEWGELLLCIATGDDAAEASRREALVSAVGAWVRQEARRAEQPFYAVLVFPFTGGVSDELSEAIKALRIEDPQQRWGLITWTADLAVELVDRHTGFPPVDHEVAQVLTEVPRGAAEEAWRSATGPRLGARRNPLGNLGYVPATRLILATTVAAYLAVILIGGGGLGNLLTGGPTGQSLAVWGANHGRLVIDYGQHWRLFTYMLLHGGLMHLGFNMWALWQVGRYVELVYGSARMVFIYVVAGVAGGIASTVFRSGAVLSVGASGAILGLMGALVYFAMALPGRRVDWQGLLAPVGINLAFGFLVGGIDNYAHIGGFIGGLLAAFLAGIPGQRKPWRLAAMAGVTVAMLLLLAGRIPLVHLPLFGR